MGVIAELDLIISKVSKARTAHVCAYCSGPIKVGEHYMKFTIRHKRERFARDKAVCNKHKPELIPMSVVLNG
jgi:urease beta subunit